MNAKYEIDEARLNNAFTYHPPKCDQGERYTLIRAKAKEFAELICGHCPPSRETSLAMTKLEEAVFWANAAIARNEGEIIQECDPPPPETT